MMPTQDLFPAAYPWLFLVITMITAFVKPKLWPIGLACTLISGFFYGAIDFIGLSTLSLISAMAFYAQMRSNKGLENPWYQIITSVITVFVIIGCIALAAHIVPGFNNLLVLSNVEKSINSVPFTLYFNFDKPMILFILLILYPTVLTNNKSVSLFKITHNSDKKLPLTVVIVISFIFIFSLAIFLSLITFEPQLPNWWWLFAINNLLLTCLIEEVFFRGFIQQKLTTRFNPILGIIVASFLFGLAHFAGGFNYVLVATLAGFLYGFVYLNTGKIWSAILIHFCLNMVHLYLFTYPLIK